LIAIIVDLYNKYNEDEFEPKKHIFAIAIVVLLIVMIFYNFIMPNMELYKNRNNSISYSEQLVLTNRYNSLVNLIEMKFANDPVNKHFSLENAKRLYSYQDGDTYHSILKSLNNYMLSVFDHK